MIKDLYVGEYSYLYALHQYHTRGVELHLVENSNLPTLNVMHCVLEDLEGERVAYYDYTGLVARTYKGLEEYIENNIISNYSAHIDSIDRTSLLIDSPEEVNYKIYGTDQALELLNAVTGYDVATKVGFRAYLQMLAGEAKLRHNATLEFAATLLHVTMDYKGYPDEVQKRRVLGL